MKNFDPVGYTRQKWYDPKHVKNRPYSCDKSHSFCNFEYEWATERTKTRSINRPLNSSLPNIDLPLPSEKVIKVNYESITQENLDDWIAQSINRNLGSMLNPQKKFFLPPSYEEEIRARYRRNKEIKNVSENETYFQNNEKKVKGYLNKDRRKKISINSLCFDFNKLEPHQDMTGTPIKIRQMKKIQKKQIRRRNAVILNNDVHYARLLKQMNKQKSVVIEQMREEPISVSQKQMVYSYNLQSMSRKDCFEDVPNSLIQKEYERIKKPQQDLLTSHRALMNKQEQLHEKYRLQMNQKTSTAINQIKDMANFAKNPIPSNVTTSSIKRQQTFVAHHKNLASVSTEIQQKEKKHLQNKVIKLLNDMQVQSQYINQNMAKLNIHVNQILLQQPDSRPQTKWILKAQQKIKDGKNLLAMDCYKQAIILQPQFFIPVFNIAVLLEKQNMLESSALWFNLAKQFHTDIENVLFGISLVALKQLKFLESLNIINELIQKVENSGKKMNPVYLYMRALCHKQIGFFQEAKRDYNLIANEMKPTNFNVLSNFIFSVVFSKVRRIPLQFNCLSYMLFKETIFLILYEQQKKMKDQDQSLSDIAEKLMQGSFFNRFSLNLVKKLLKSAVYEQKQKGEIIFSVKNSTSIIINGIVSLKSHENQFNRPEMVTVLNRGGIIGAGDLQNNISSKPNNWFTALSKVELITVPKQDFSQFWRGQITFKMDFKYNFLKNVDLLKNLPDCILFKLCQLFEEKTYEKGTILFNDCSYRTQMVSKPGKGYGLAKYTQKADARMIYNGQSLMSKNGSKKKGKSKLYQMIKKHIFKFNEMKFNRMKYPGIFIIVKGSVELEDDRGFRCSGVISEREFFGQNIVIDAEGYQNYGRLVAETQNLQVLLLDIEKIPWVFNQQDKNKMAQNCKDRQTVQTVRFLRNRFSECQNFKLKSRLNN